MLAALCHNTLLHSNLMRKVVLACSLAGHGADRLDLHTHSGEDTQDWSTQQSKLLASEPRSNG